MEILSLIYLTFGLDFHPLRSTSNVKVETKAARFLIKLSWTDCCTTVDLPAPSGLAELLNLAHVFAQVVMTQGSPRTRKADQH